MAMSLLLVVCLLLLLYQLEFFELLCQSNSLFNQLQEQHINQSIMWVRAMLELGSQYDTRPLRCVASELAKCAIFAIFS